MNKKDNPVLQAILAGVAAVSLLIYVLACATSFSPDDRRVLYPSFDPQTGAAAVALYDRQSGRSDLLYVAADSSTNQQAIPMRAEWLPDGKHVLIAQTSGDDDLEVLVLPRGVDEPVRRFILTKAKDATVSLEFPFAIAGSWLFLNGEKRDPLRLDLITGEVAGGADATDELFAIPSPDGKSVVGLRDEKAGAGMEFGAIDPQTLQFKRLGQVGTNVAEGTLPAFDPADGRLIFVSKSGGQLQLQVVKDGQTEFTRPLNLAGRKMEPGPFLDLAGDGKTVLISCRATMGASTNAEYGLLEIPLSDAPLRFTPLFHAKASQDAELIMAQPSLSHDGNTWAIGTASLYEQDSGLDPADCALFLVDLSKPDRPVTKVPILPPNQRKPLVR